MMSFASDRKAIETPERNQADATFGYSIRRLILWGSLVVSLGSFAYLKSSKQVFWPSLELSSINSQPKVQLCPQAAMLFPKHHQEIWRTMEDRLSDKTFEKAAIDWLAGSIQIP